MSDFVQPPWWHSAACSDLGDFINFFPSRGEDSRPAKRVCTDCPVREECLHWAIETKEAHGVWGGMSERERRRIRRDQVRVSRCIGCGVVIRSARHRIRCDECSAIRRRELKTISARELRLKA